MVVQDINIRGSLAKAIQELSVLFCNLFTVENYFPQNLKII